jgi:hypothetical protein
VNGLTKEMIASICEQALVEAKHEFRESPACRATYDRMALWMKDYCARNGVTVSVAGIINVGHEGVHFRFYPYEPMARVRITHEVS